MCGILSDKTCYISEGVTFYKFLVGGRFSPFYLNHKYKKNCITNKVRLGKIHSRYNINLGYHYITTSGFYSYREKPEKHIIKKFLKLFKARLYWIIIPKGGRYYISCNNEIISDQIIIGRRVNWFNKLLNWKF